jgi:hypothetical protein
VGEPKSLICSLLESSPETRIPGRLSILLFGTSMVVVSPSSNPQKAGYLGCQANEEHPGYA